MSFFLKLGRYSSPHMMGLFQMYLFASFNTFTRWLLSAHRLGDINSERREMSGGIHCQEHNF